MSKTVKIPDPVYDDAKEAAEAGDTTIGAVIADWRDDSRDYERVLGKIPDADASGDVVDGGDG